MGSIAFLSLLIAFAAHHYNRGRIPRIPGTGCGTVDSARWVAVMVFGLHFWDFVSDINLVAEILSRYDLTSNTMIMVAGIGSTAFVIIPYVVNLYIATKIQHYIANNETARIFFQRNSIFFGLLVAATGGCYSAVSLLSSNIFGLRKFSSGLTRFEISKLSKIKVFGTVILENVPQLLFQLVYVASIDEITDAVAISFGASMLSVVASTLSYFVDRNTFTDGSTVVHYYLSLQCREARSGSISPCTPTGFTAARAFFTAGATTPGGPTPGGPGRGGGITEEEKLTIHVNRGRRRALAEQLAAAYGIDSKRIEIGETSTTKYGSTTHIVQMVYHSDMDAFNARFGDDGEVTEPQRYTRRLYKSVKADIEEAMRNHFLLGDEFVVVYHKVSMMSHAKNESIMGMPSGLERIVSTSEAEFGREAVGSFSDGHEPLDQQTADEQKINEVVKSYLDKYCQDWPKNKEKRGPRRCCRC